MNSLLENRIKEIEDLSLRKKDLMDDVANDTLKHAGIGFGAALGMTAIVLSFGGALPLAAAASPALFAAKFGAKGAYIGHKSAQRKKDLVAAIDAKMEEMTKKLITDLCNQLNSGHAEMADARDAYNRLSKIDTDFESEIKKLSDKLEGC